MNDLYKVQGDGDTDVTVMCDTGKLPVHKRTGKQSYFVCYQGKQININSIPFLDTHVYPVYYGYIFHGLWQTKPNFYYDYLLSK